MAFLLIFLLLGTIHTCGTESRRGHTLFLCLESLINAAWDYKIDVVALVKLEGGVRDVEGGVIVAILRLSFLDVETCHRRFVKLWLVGKVTFLRGLVRFGIFMLIKGLGERVVVLLTETVLILI